MRMDAGAKEGTGWGSGHTHVDIHHIFFFNPLSANPTKWSNTLKQFVHNSRQIVCV